MQLSACPSCTGFLPPSAASCPHCGADAKAAEPRAVGSLVRGLVAVASGGAMAVTLMACYGLPPCEDDADNDGYCLQDDCDDTDPTINNYADDPLGDGIDQNCDGVDGYNPDASTSSGSDGGACFTCAYLASHSGADEAQACPTSAPLFQALKDCTCTTECSAVCAANVCSGTDGDAACQECVEASCSQQLDACKADF